MRDKWTMRGTSPTRHMENLKEEINLLKEEMEFWSSLPEGKGEKHALTYKYSLEVRERELRSMEEAPIKWFF